MASSQHKLRSVGPNAKGVPVRQKKINRHRMSPSIIKTFKRNWPEDHAAKMVMKRLERSGAS